jgi:hypothetical protein
VITGLLVTIFLYFCFERQGLGASSGPADTLDTRASGTLLRTARDLVVANVNGVSAAVVGQGVLLGVGFWFVDLRSPVLWGFVGGLASILAMAGAPLVWRVCRRLHYQLAAAVTSPRHNRQEPLRRTTAPDRMPDRIFCTGYTQWRVLTAVRRRRFLRDRPKRRRDLIQIRTGKLSERDVSLGPCVGSRKQPSNPHALKLYERADWDALMHFLKM